MDDIPRLNSKAVFSPFTKGRKRKKPEPEPEPPAPDPQVPETCDKQIMRAMGVLANAIRKAVIEANESTTSAARKAELEAWIERNETEISGRIHVSIEPYQDRRPRWSGTLQWHGDQGVNS
jgi:hypothetical protein